MLNPYREEHGVLLESFAFQGPCSAQHGGLLGTWEHSSSQKRAWGSQEIRSILQAGWLTKYSMAPCSELTGVLGQNSL